MTLRRASAELAGPHRPQMNASTAVQCALANSRQTQKRLCPGQRPRWRMTSRPTHNVWPKHRPASGSSNPAQRMPGSTAKRACTGPAPGSQGDIFNRAVTLLNEFMFDDAHWPAVSALLEGAYEARNSGVLVGEGLEGNVRIHFAGAISQRSACQAKPTWCDSCSRLPGSRQTAADREITRSPTSRIS